MKKWMIRALSVLLIAAFLPVSVLADEYDLSEGSVTISTSKREDGSTRQDVSHKGTTKPDSNPTISSSGKTENTITIKADAGTTANVTIKDTNIDSSGTGKAAIKTEGKGDVNLNVEGKNTVTSDGDHAGVEKSNEGNLTIGSKSGSGELTANGGDYGAGIGGGRDGSGSDITITGGDITANGGGGAAGIGGGNCGDGSNITISGGEVTANGGKYGAGIGGGYDGDGSDITISGGEVDANGSAAAAGIGGGAYGDGSNITITDGKVTTSSGTLGAGIGGGVLGDGSNITISGASQVSAIGGSANDTFNSGAAVGNGGSYEFEGAGAEVLPDTSGLYTTGKVERKSGDGTALDTITGTVEPPAPTEPEEPTEPEKSVSSEEEPDKREPLYRVLYLDGSSLKHQAETADGILALTAQADGAILTGTLRALGYLQNQGIEKIIFTDGTHSAELVLAELIARGEPEDVYVLTLGAENTLTLNGEAIDL